MINHIVDCGLTKLADDVLLHECSADDNVVIVTWLLGVVMKAQKNDCNDVLVSWRDVND